MSKVLVRAYLERPTASGDVPANGYIEAKPSLRRDLDDPDSVILPAKFNARLGAELVYTDNSDVEQTAAAEDGVAWFWIDATDAGEFANMWFWTFTERTTGGTRRYVVVPTSALTLDYTDDLTDIDPTTYEPGDPTLLPGWSVALAAETAARIAGDATIEASDVDTVAGVAPTSGNVPVAGLKTALALPTDTAAELAVQLAAINAEIVVRAAEDLALQADIEAEAALARNADNLTSGTIPDARIPAAITRDSEVAALVAAELVAYQPGLEIGYAERTTSATSTQTAPNATGTISGLSVTVVGSGRAVDIRFAAPLAWHSVAGKMTFTSLMVSTNGGAAVAGGAAHGSSSPLTNNGPGQTWNRRMVLTNGVSYTFTVAVYTEVASGGTSTVFANATYPMSLSVTNR